MVDTVPDLIARLQREDPGRPLVTFYDDASGERVELSVATYANWVAKTASLLVEVLDLERGQRLLVDLPTHWLGPVFLGAAWSAGLVVVREGDAAAVVCGPEGVGGYADRSTGPVLATALLPLGVRFADPLPSGVLDFGIEVWSQPDAFVPWDPPSGDDEAVPGVTQRELLSSADELADGDRLLTTANPVSEGLVAFVSLLARRGSGVWVRNADPGRWDDRYAAERATSR